MPPGLAVVLRAVAPAAALGTGALPQTIPAVAAPVAAAGRGKGRKVAPINTLNSRNVSNAPPQAGPPTWGHPYRML